MLALWPLCTRKVQPSLSPSHFSPRLRLHLVCCDFSKGLCRPGFISGRAGRVGFLPEPPLSPLSLPSTFVPLCALGLCCPISLFAFSG